MIIANNFDFKASFLEHLDFRYHLCSFPNPVDIWINGEPIIKNLTKRIFPNTKFENNNIYEKFIPYSAEVYRRYLLNEGKNIHIFSRMCNEEPMDCISIDIIIDKNKVVWTNWKYLGKSIKNFPEILFDKEIYTKARSKLDRFINRIPREITAYRPIDDALWLFIEARDFSLDFDSMNSYRRIETDSWPLRLDVNEFGEVVFCEWDLAMAQKYPGDVIEAEMKFLITECGLWIPGIYKLGDFQGSFWDINRLLIETLKTP